MSTLKRYVYKTPSTKIEAGLMLNHTAGNDYVDLRFSAASRQQARKVFLEVHELLKRHTRQWREEER